MVIPSGFAQCNWQFGGLGLPTGGECTMGFDLGSYAGTPADLAEVLFNAWATTVITVQSPDIELRSTLVKYGPDATGPSAIYTDTAVGGNSGQSSPPQSTLLAQKVTEMGGRAGRGRLFIPGVVDAGILAGGSLNPDTVTVFQTELNDLYALLTAGDFTPVLLHSVGSPITTPTPITSLQVQSQSASQRRRNRR